MISRSLLELTFNAFSIQRWNDHPRLIHFTEMDKQAHKAMIAWILARAEEDEGHSVDWIQLIEGGIFDFLHRVILTDLKPPFFHKMMAHAQQKSKLNCWVADQISPELAKLDLQIENRFKTWLLEDKMTLERKILQAAHFMASRWEFEFIEPLAKPLKDTPLIKQQLLEQVQQHDQLVGVKKALEENSKLTDFISLVGQLRFQNRWAQTPRLPSTSVLGHLLMVAHLAYYLSLETNVSPHQCRHNFYGGLWHDLPEALTRDIISPIKRSVEGLDELIKSLEKEEMESALSSLIPDNWINELNRYTNHEFETRTYPTNEVQIFPEDLNFAANLPKNGWAIDGKLIEACDKLSAYIEASVSIRLGVAPAQLIDGRRRIEEKFSNRKLGDFYLCQLFDFYR